VELYVGVGAARVRDLFAKARKNAPCVVFIDEIDAVGGRRHDAGVGNSEWAQTLNQLLIDMDGFEPSDGVVVLAATNRPDAVDPALRRPGRFDEVIAIPLPDERGRKEILDFHVKQANMPLAKGVELGSIAAKTWGLAGADLESIVNKAAMAAADEAVARQERGVKKRPTSIFGEPQGAAPAPAASSNSGGKAAPAEPVDGDGFVAQRHFEAATEKVLEACQARTRVLQHEPVNIRVVE
jgi:SpoVK/Ycf46/Vps4 family AAA+-type ATPase